MRGRYFSLASLVVRAAVGYAQDPVPILPAVTSVTALSTDTIPVWGRPNGLLLRPGLLTYRLSLHRRDGGITSLGSRTVEVSDVAVAGTPGWLIAESRSGTPVTTTDSVFLTRTDLSPARWVATIGSAELEASLTPDSIFGAVRNYQGRASFIVALPQGALLSAGMTERLIEMLPLRVGFRAAASLMLVEGHVPRMEQAVIEVVREDLTEFGGRAVDCWIVIIRTGAREQRLWVSKDSVRVVRSEQALTSGLYFAELQP